MQEILAKVIEHLKRAPEIAELLSYLESKSTADGGLDPKDELNLEPWNIAIYHLINAGFPLQALNVCNFLYNLQLHRQAELGSRIHKGLVTHNTGLIKHIRGDSRTAKWYFLLAFVEDVLNSNDPIPSKPATTNLRTIYGLTDTLLAEIAAVARSEKEYLMYPEAVLTRIARRNDVSLQISNDGDSIPISKQFLRTMVNALDQGNQNEKGQRLEFLTSYLMTTLPGARIIPNAKSPDSETDLVVTLDGMVDGYLVEAFGRNFLVECKNWERAVNTTQINHFAAKVRFGRCRAGLLIAKNGISGSGSESLSDGSLTSIRWYHQDGILVVVLDKGMFETLMEKDVTVSQYILAEYEKTRFSLV